MGKVQALSISLGIILFLASWVLETEHLVSYLLTCTGGILLGIGIALVRYNRHQRYYNRQGRHNGRA